MSLLTMRRTVLVVIFFVNLAGCSFFKSAASDDDADLTDMDDAQKAAAVVQSENTPAIDAPPKVGQLGIRLSVGDQFPLRKTVEQRLVQIDKAGESVSTTQTDMILSLVVEKTQPDGTVQMNVRYQKVRYIQDIRGQRISYSSENPHDQIPHEALLYSGLADNEFSFWMGPNNKIVKTIGFNDFLKRCLRKVPSQHISTVQQQLESMKSDDGIANFIDDSIGLLPFSDDPSHPAVAVKEGSYWDLEPKYSEKPFRTFATTRCLLKELSPQYAEIVLSGKISGPPTGVTMRGAEGDMKILVKDGHSSGTCRVDRKTGLPTQSRVLRYLELAMEMPDGQKIQQNKETISTITSFLDQVPPTALNPNNPIQQISVQNAVGTENHRRVQHAGGTTSN